MHLPNLSAPGGLIEDQPSGGHCGSEDSLRATLDRSLLQGGQGETLESLVAPFTRGSVSPSRRGPGLTPGASSYTLKRLSLSLSLSIRSLLRRRRPEGGWVCEPRGSPVGRRLQRVLHLHLGRAKVHRPRVPARREDRRADESGERRLERDEGRG